MSPFSSSNRRIRVPLPAARRKSEPVRGTRVYGALAARLAVAFLLLIAGQGAAAAASIPGEGPARPVRADQGVTWSNFAPASWVMQVAFSSSVTASSSADLDASSDAYSVSTDGGANWSAWSTTGLSTAIPIPTRHDITVTNLTLPDSASLNLIRFRVTETGGVVNFSEPYLLRVDATPPASPQNLAANPPAWTNAASFTVSWTNPSDAAGIAGARYKLNSPPTSPTDGTFVITSNSIDGITPGTPGVNDGAHRVYVWLQDIFGRTDPQTASTTTLYWDTTAPDPPSLFSASPARRWVNINKFSESWRNPSDLSGIVGAYYKLNAAPTSPTDGQFVTTVNSISDIQVPYDGKHDIYVWLVDAAGNVDQRTMQSDADIFWYDGSPPVSTAHIAPTLPATGWYTSSVSMSFSATDAPVDPSLPPVIEYQLDSAAWTVTPQVLTIGAEGSHLLKYRARDKAGNIEKPDREFNFGIDKNAPTVTLAADRLPNASGWYTAAVTYTLSIADAVSGSPQGFYRLNDGQWQHGQPGSPVTFTVAADGSYRIEYYGIDAAGNRSQQKTLEANVDGAPPEVTLTIDGTQGDNGWWVSGITGQLAAVDDVSGTPSTRYQIDGGPWQTGATFSLSVDGIHDVAYYAKDAAGNVGPVQTTQLMLDRVAPAAPADLTAAPAGWSSTNSFTVQWTSPAGLSGVAGVYVKLGDISGGGAPTGPKDGTAITATQRIDGLAVPAEGAYRLYLWLRDTAGNADHTTAPTNGPVLRYDATPPTTTAQVQGKAGVDGWWLSPITATLTAMDSASGVAGLHYRLDAGAWQSTNKNTVALTVSQPDKHVIEYYAEDVAGNVEATKQYTVRLDLTPPPAPPTIRALPQGWTRFNSFHLEWPTVTDLSGIGGAYVKFDAAPATGTDGVFYSGSTQIDEVKAPSEGRHSVYVWLRDGAGNADFRASVAISDSVWYDGTPPASLITPTAASGLNGWYVEPVTFDISATEAASGLLEVDYQVDEGPIQSANATAFPPDTRKADSSFVLSQEGRHTVRIWAVDRAGNVEPAHVFDVAIDKTPPRASFSGPAGSIINTLFDVSWSGVDYGAGSGLAAYDVQVRDGYVGAWQNWLTGTTLTSAQYQAERGHVYYFRVFGRDRAGNRQETPGAWKVLVQPVLNGGFDTGNFADWTVGGLLYSAVVATTGLGNASTLAAKLGSEVYGPSLTPPGNVPGGCATITQTITIPSLQQMREPRLRFSHRVLTYDVMYSANLGAYVDTLDVKLTDELGQQSALLLRTGNPTSVWGSLYDTGWQLADLDLKEYAGRTLQLSFANCNGPQAPKSPDNMLNTWSYVDGIQIYDRNPMYLPVITQAAPAGVQAAGSPDPITAEETTVPGTPVGAEPVR